MVMTVLGTIAYNFGTTFPSMVRFGFGRSAGSVGTVMSVSAIGSIIGGVYIAGVTPHPRRTLAITLAGFRITSNFGQDPESSASIFPMPADIVHLLRKHGVQVTAQRVAILGAVERIPHATADAVADEVRATIGTVSRQAVYDSLGMLTDRQLLRRIQPAGSPARYERRVGDNHHHLICRACGTTVDIDCAVGARPCLIADDDHGFLIDEAEVIYWGQCPTCRDAAPNS